VEVRIWERLAGAEAEVMDVEVSVPDGQSVGGYCGFGTWAAAVTAKAKRRDSRHGSL
jgi:hypothetical protein